MNYWTLQEISMVEGENAKRKWSMVGTWRIWRIVCMRCDGFLLNVIQSNINIHDS